MRVTTPKGVIAVQKKYIERPDPSDWLSVIMTSLVIRLPVGSWLGCKAKLWLLYRPINDTVVHSVDPFKVEDRFHLRQNWPGCGYKTQIERRRSSTENILTYHSNRGYSLVAWKVCTFRWYSSLVDKSVDCHFRSVKRFRSSYTADPFQSARPII